MKILCLLLTLAFTTTAFGLDNLVEKTVTNTDTTGTTNSDAISMFGATSIAVQAVIDENTDAAKNFLAGEAELTTATFANKAGTAAGDYLVIYDTAGLAWAVAADLDGDDDEPTGAIWTAIPAARKGQADLTAATDAASVAAAFELAFDALTDVPFATDDTAANGTMTFLLALYGVTTDAVVKDEDDSAAGSIAEAQTDQGVDSTVNIDDDEITIAAHGLPTGMKGRLTSTGTLPAGVTTGVDYFVIVVDANTISLAESLVLALAGTAIDLTNQGTDGATHTFTPTALAGATVKLEKSNDKVTWSDVAAATSITADATVWLEDDAPGYRWARVTYAITAGSMTSNNYVLVKGED